MQKKSLIKQNILYFIEYKGISKYRFYQKTGITRGILDQDNGMSEENTAKFLAYFPEVSPEWLLTGRGDMLRQTKSDTQTGDINNSNIIGSNVNGSGISINATPTELLDVIKKQQEHIDKLLNIIDNKSSS